MSLSLVKAPTMMPVSLAEAKAQLRVTSGAEDELIDRLIRAATQRMDGPNGRLGRCLLDQTWSLTLDRVSREIAIDLAPVLSIVSVSDLDDGDFTAHRLNSLDGAILRPTSGGAWWKPASAERIITFRAGFGEAPEDVPEPIRAAILMHVAHLYERRESVTMSSVALVETIQGYDDLIAPYRVWSF